MELNELMIGDWLQHASGKYFQVTRIDMWRDGSVHFACGHPHLWEYNNKFTPIPLIAEILEKNGFVEFMPHNWQIVIDNIMIELREPEHNMAIWLDWDEHDTGTYASYMLPKPDCVHELQHALRLCNIEKTIEL